MKSNMRNHAAAVLELVAFTALVSMSLAVRGEELKVVRTTSGGMLCKLDGARNVLFLEGTPERMGTAHGTLVKSELPKMYQRVMLVAAGYALTQNAWFFDRIDDAARRTRPYVPDRFYDEMNAMARAADMTPDQIRQINVFPELFHCSGIAVAGKATKDGRVRHVRVLDYMRDIGLQRFASLIVYRPQGRNAWCSVSYSGFIGSVTAMNEKGLAMGEMGGGGEGKWDGLPMSFLIRRVMEECENVGEAVAMLKSTPLTCDYYYILSDRSRTMAAVEAIAGSAAPVRIIGPGKSDPRLPGAIEDSVYITAPGVRADTLYARLKQSFGAIDTPALMAMVKRPVAMNSNLHNAIFEPETLNVWFAEAGRDTPACDERYFHVNLKELLKRFDELKKSEEDSFFDE